MASLERQGGSIRRRRSIRGDGGAPRESPFLSDLVHITSTGREERLNSSKYSAASSAAVPRQRMRSRSAGRQSARLTGVSAANPLYGTIGHSTSLYAHRSSVVPQSGKNSPYRQPPDRPHSAARLRNNVINANTSGAAGAYSSDSNGASPPPEVRALLMLQQYNQ